MPRPLGQFFITDAFTADLGWKLSPGQQSTKAVVYVNNQSPQEFDIWGNGVDFLGTAPAWISFWKFTMPLLYSFVEFRPTMSLNPLGPPALYCNGIVFESYEPDPHWQPIAVVRQTDMARQIRSVSVPMGLDHWDWGLWASTDPATKVLETMLPSAAQLAAGFLPIYFYYANLTPHAGETGSMSFTVEIQWLDGSNNPVGGPFRFARGGVAANMANQTIEPWVFAPSWPFAYTGGAVGNIPPTAVKAQSQLTYQNGTRISIDYGLSIWADQFNVIGNGSIGTQAIYNSFFPNINPYF